MSVSNGFTYQSRISDVLARILFTDNYSAVCTGEIPQTNWPAYLGPTPWDRYDNNLQELCVGNWGFFFAPTALQLRYPPSLWCRCPYDMSSGIICDSPFSSSPIVQSLTLIEYCVEKCSCSRFGLPPATGYQESKPQTPPLLSSPSRRKKENRRAQKANRKADAILNMIERERKAPVSQRKSGSKDTECPALQSCNSSDACSAQRLISGCESVVCKVSESSPGKFLGLGTCLIPLITHTKIGGRSIFMDACPCNQSYVSTACCTASDGYVYESGGKLGELVEV